ncbi:MAG: phosphatase PAP2 family protein [Verrucomicrobia bacterium]|nr:phosphatase PAP2 family protein [Verrucomicrobiota bacterium]
MDKSLLLLINHEWTNPVLDSLMATMTNFSVWLPFLFLIGIVLLWRGDFRARSFVIVTLLTLAVTDGLFTQFAKRLVRRPRPHEALADVREVRLERTHPAFLAVVRPPLVAYSPAPPADPGGRSFPSGHATNNAAIAANAIRYFRRWGWLYAIPGSLVAYSRIYCGSHWPSDVLVSIPLGVIMAVLLTHALARLYQLIGPKWFARQYRRHPELIPA